MENATLGLIGLGLWFFVVGVAVVVFVGAIIHGANRED